MILSTWNLAMSSGANGTNATSFGCNIGSGWNSRWVVECDLAVYWPLLAVYSNRTPDGTSCIVYLLSDLYSVYTHVYVYHSSGAYRGLTVGSVEGVAAQDHRDSRVDKYWQRHLIQDETIVDESFEQSSGQIYKSLSTVRSMAYEAYKKFTQFNTFSHFIALCDSPYPQQRGQYARPTPTTDQYFTLFCIYWSFYSSLELPQALNPLPLYTRLRIYIYSLASIRIHMH